MRTLLTPARSSSPNPGHCLDHLPQSFPDLAAALARAGHEVSGLSLNCTHDPEVEAELRSALDRSVPRSVGVGGLPADSRFVRGLEIGAIPSKRGFFETIHTRPRFDLTEIPDVSPSRSVKGTSPTTSPPCPRVGPERHEMRATSAFDPPRTTHDVATPCARLRPGIQGRFGSSVRAATCASSSSCPPTREPRPSRASAAI